MRIEFSSRRQRRERNTVLYWTSGPSVLFSELGAPPEQIVDHFTMLFDAVCAGLMVPQHVLVGTPRTAEDTSLVTIWQASIAGR